MTKASPEALAKRRERAARGQVAGATEPEAEQVKIADEGQCGECGKTIWSGGPPTDREFPLTCWACGAENALADAPLAPVPAPEGQGGGTGEDPETREMVG